MKTFVAAVFAASVTSLASAGFIIEDPPEAGNSWSQRIVLEGSFDAIAFEIISRPTASPFGSPGNMQFGFGHDNSPSFAEPGITGFIDPSGGGSPLGGWNAEFLSPTLVVASGFDASSMEVTLHFEGEVDQPVSFRGVAFQDGEFQFSADFVWDGGDGSGMGLGMIDIVNIDGWQPTPGSVGMAVMIPLPASVWLGSLGLVAVIILRRRFH
jgi:hypothetical protein